MYSFPNMEPVHCFMSGSNCCFLTCMQVYQETGKAVWYSHLFKNFPQSVVIHTVKSFSVVNEAEVDVFLEFLCIFYDPADVGNLISSSSAFSKSSLNIWMFMVQVQKLHLDISPQGNAIGDSFPIDLNSQRITGRQSREEAWPYPGHVSVLPEEVRRSPCTTHA